MSKANEVLENSRIEGRVLDTSGNAIAGAEVWAVGVGHFVRTQSTNDGRFSFRSLRPGGYSVYARNDFLASKRAERIHWNARVQNSAGGIVLVLEPARILRGCIVDAYEHPISNAEIHIVTRSQSDSLRFEAKSNDYGFFKCSLSADASIEIMIDALGFERRFIDFPVEGLLNDVGKIIMEPLRSLRGFVYDTDSSQPIENAEVTLGYWNGDAFVRFQQIVAQSGADGAFELQAPEGRGYALHARHLGRSAFARRVDLTAEDGPFVIIGID